MTHAILTFPSHPILSHPSRKPSLLSSSLQTLTLKSLRTSVPTNHFSKIQAVARAIEKETPEKEQPETFLREADSSSDSSSVRARFERMIREAQDSVCAAIETVDGGKFKEDVWSRPGGGGGISRVLQDGDVWEKAGVNVSVVYGTMPPEAYRAARGEGSAEKPGPVPFFAAGISSVLHPKNPFAPTLHFNYRYFETDAPKDAVGAPRQWWFGGGTDLTPAYIFEEDVRHFHMASRILANLIVMGSGILARALVQAYRQAITNASKTGVAQETMQNAVRRTSKTMTEQEARQILGIAEQSSWEEILQKYDHLFEMNAKNGSFYLQSKVHKAKECLEAAHQGKSQGSG